MEHRISVCFEGELIPVWPVADIWILVTHKWDRARDPPLSALGFGCFCSDLDRIKPPSAAICTPGMGFQSVSLDS